MERRASRADPLPTVNFPVPNPEAAAPSALATGDLDGLADAAGNLHDEAVIAFKDADDGLEVRVVDYNATPGRATLTAPQGLLPGVGGPAAPGSIAAGIGDFDAERRQRDRDRRGSASRRPAGRRTRSCT